MLKHWQTHAEYQQFISETVALLHPSQLKKLYSMSDSWDKLTSLNLDPVGDFLAAFYSNTGRPALNQPQILRSFVLMLDRRFTSLTKWTGELKGDDLLAMLIGCSPDSLPPLGSYFDFINRLWLRNPDFEKSGRGDLFPAGKTKSPLPNLEKIKSFLTGMPASLKELRIMPSQNGISLFIMKKPYSSFSPLLPLSLLWNWDSLFPTTSR